MPTLRSRTIKLAKSLSKDDPLRRKLGTLLKESSLASELAAEIKGLERIEKRRDLHAEDYDEVATRLLAKHDAKDIIQAAKRLEPHHRDSLLMFLT